MKIEPVVANIRDTGTERGRGVFASRAYQAGDIVEVCPVVIFAKGEPPLPNEISCIVFDWSYLVTRAPGLLSALALGYGSLYNHDNPANMRYEAVPDLLALRFIAVRNIATNEELTINYNAHGGGAEWPDDNWFERKKLKPIVSASRNA